MTRHTAAQVAAPGFLSSVLKPILLSVALTFLALFLLAICIATGLVSMPAANAGIPAATAICVFLAGFLSAKGSARHGFLRGAAAGALYGLVAYLVSALAFSSFSPSPSFWKLWGLEIAVGSVGGTIGINVGGGRRKKA